MGYEELAMEVGQIKVILQRLEARLLGNGQPGDIDKHNSRITKLESALWFIKGAIWIIGTLVTLGISGGLIHIFKLR